VVGDKSLPRILPSIPDSLRSSLEEFREIMHIISEKKMRTLKKILSH